MRVVGRSGGRSRSERKWGNGGNNKGSGGDG